MTLNIRKPTLNGLNGSYVIPNDIRKKTRVLNGVLVCTAKHWTDMELLIRDYLYQDNVDIRDEPSYLLNQIINSLSNLKMYLEKVREDSLNGTCFSFSKHNSAAVIPQLALIVDYCKRVEAFFMNPAIKKRFHDIYKGCLEEKKIEDLLQAREDQEDQAMNTLLHKGKMNAFLAAEHGSNEITNDLNNKFSVQSAYDMKKREHPSNDISTTNKRLRADEDNVEDNSDDEDNVVEDNSDDEDNVEDNSDDEDNVEEDNSGDEDNVEDNSDDDDNIEDNSDDEDNVDDNQGTVETPSYSSTPISSGGLYIPNQENSFDSLDVDVTTVPYALTYHELYPVSHLDINSISFLSASLSFEDRLKLSKIRYYDKTSEKLIKFQDLNANFEKTIKQWCRGLISGGEECFLIPATKNESKLITSLNTCYTHISSYCPDDSIYETNFKIKFVAPFLNLLADNDISIAWDIPSSSILANENFTRITTDIILKYNNLEIGVGEVKPCNSSDELVEEDRIRLGEMLKKLLHVRMSKAKSVSEFITFGIMIFGENVEYYVMTYNNRKYEFKLIQKSILPTLPSSYTHMAYSLECLLGYKNIIVDSVKHIPETIKKEYIFMNYRELLKPTVTLVKL